MTTLPRRALLALPLAFAFLLSTPALAFGGPKDAWIDFFGGWASQHGGKLYARVHHGKPPPADHQSENAAEKLLHTIEQLELDAIAGAHVTIALQGHAGLTAVADSHGFLEVTLPAGLHGPLNKITITKPADHNYKVATAAYLVPVWADKPGQIGVISDIDDTLTDSDVPHKIHLAYNTLFHSQYDVKVFPGAGHQVSAVVGAAYKGLPVRPCFYLSGSPWNLHTRISGAFTAAGLPHGAFVLRRFSKEPQNAYDFKHPHLREIFAAFPETKWVLFGDTGEKDPEVYATMRQEKPNNIGHIFIHNVTKANPQDARFSNMSVFNQWPDTAAAIAEGGFAFGHANAAAASHQ